MDVIVHVIGPVGWSSMSCGEPAAQRRSRSFLLIQDIISLQARPRPREDHAGGAEVWAD